MPVDINGTTGVTTPGLASTAMPTSGGDLIVESGSNSDGEWTKFADGTLHCTQLRVESFSVTTLANSYYYAVLSWAPPAVFIEQPFYTAGFRSTGAVISVATAGEDAIEAVPATFPVYAIAPAQVANRAYLTRWFATGRWK